MKTPRILHIRTVVYTALLIALACIVNMFRVTLPIAGVQALRISFSGVFLRFAAVVFGPVYGGIADAVTDVVSHFIKPEGAYIPPLTATACLRGVLAGFIWTKIKNADPKKTGVYYLSFFTVLGIWGLINLITIKYISYGPYYDFLCRIGAQNEFTQTNRIFISAGRILVTAGVMAISAISAAAYIAVWVLRGGKRRQTGDDYMSEYLKLLFATGIPCLLLTTVNTEILRLYFLLPDKAFILLWIPRVIEETALVLINAHLLVVFMHAYKKNVQPVCRS